MFDQSKEHLSSRENRTIQEDNFKGIIAMYVPENIKNKAKKEIVNIMSVGCGTATEIPGIKESFPFVNYMGIDNDRRFLDLGKRYYPEYADKLLEKDARDEKSFTSENDLVIIRNSQVFGSTPEDIINGRVTSDWDKILTNSINSTNKTGVLLVTTNSAQEIEALLKYLMSNHSEVKPILAGRDFDKADFLEPVIVGNEDKYITVLKKILQEN